jgi:methylated-DNA-[protein]-cysteine S-methyltransferase
MSIGKYITAYRSPIGPMTLASDGTALTGLWLDGQKYFGSTLAPKVCCKELEVFGETVKWLDLYFTGRQPDFTPPLRTEGSDFRKGVWEILRSVPYGKTVTYGQIAGQLEQETGKSVSAQAVGGAVGHNPLMLIIPCHRVIGAHGNLTGYAGGIDKKMWLLQQEGIFLPSKK